MARLATQDEFQGEKPPCDLVMKGGGVSDVAYALAIVEIAKKYRFSSIGGTSAGALGASIAAAAEYARETKGFDRVAEIPNDIADGLFDQFQPEPRLRPLFDMVIVPFIGKSGLAASIAIISAAATGYPGATLLGLLPGLSIVAVALAAADWGWLAFGVVLAIAGLIIALVLRIKRAVAQELKETNFGLCSGKTVPGCRGPGVTDWLADTIDRVAGNVDNRGRFGRPLTFGDLKNNSGGSPIALAMITTDLGMKRPYKLPFREKGHLFSKAEFEKLFSPRVMAHMCRENPIAMDPRWENCPNDLYAFPEEDELPVIVAARMSLSIPFIFQCVPLYKFDLTLKNGGEQPRKCLFTDGGLTSNFPIHFFDRLWPNSPTFAIAFDEFSEERHVEDRRVEMGADLREGDVLPILPISGLGQFLFRLVDAAKDWQDSLQSVLPGYRERIVHVHLKADEGGNNLKMPWPIVMRLADLGKEAGALATSPAFSMDEHRWRRFLISMAEMEQVLEEITRAHDRSPVGGESFGEFLNRYAARASYRPTNEAMKSESEWKREMLRRAEQLVDLGRQWQKEPTIRSGRIPQPDCDFRIAPKQ